MTNNLPDQHIDNVVRITAGLLSSGHYTDSNKTTTSEAFPFVTTLDFGKDWQARHTRRHQFVAVADAITIYREILKEMEHEPARRPSPDSQP